MTRRELPVLSANDWRELDAPALGSWHPTRSVSVVVPTHRPRHLAHVLAALAAQTYPTRLLEVVVVDDGAAPPVSLPEIRPENTRVVSIEDGWGPALARHTGAERADGEVLHWLDDDMIVGRHEVEAQLRWHHLVDYAVVLGHKWFVGPGALGHLTPRQLHEEVASGASPSQLAQGPLVPHAWIEEILAATDDLATAGPRAMRVHVTASASVRRDLYLESGGFPPHMVTAEDTVLGYRLREAGAVFIPDREATAVHLGVPTVIRAQQAMNRYNKPFITDFVPEFRGHRLAVHRSYAVPYVEVVVPVARHTYEGVRAVVDSQLACSVPDVVLTLVAPWERLHGGRRVALEDPAQDLRLVQAAYSAEARVRFVSSVPERSDATFRVTLPDARHFPAGRSLERLLQEMEEQHLGLVVVDLPDGRSARIDRTASVRRAMWVNPEDPTSLDGKAYPATRRSVEEAGFVTVERAPRVPQVKGLVAWGVPPGANRLAQPSGTVRKARFGRRWLREGRGA